MRESLHSGRIYADFLKRIFDFLISLFALIFLSPVLLIMTISGAIFMHGNPFFVQIRPGKNEKLFYLIKFRTMTNEKSADGALLSDDDRLNGYGKMLRKTSLDELPELINILIGDMALVGPRPLLVQYLGRYNEQQRRRHDVRPGLTGLAQVNGRNAVSWDKKFEYDIEYINDISFKNDLKIIFKTIKSIVRQEGISSQTSQTMEEFMGNAEVKVR